MPLSCKRCSKCAVKIAYLDPVNSIRSQGTNLPKWARCSLREIKISGVWTKWDRTIYEGTLFSEYLHVIQFHKSTIVEILWFCLHCKPIPVMKKGFPCVLFLTGKSTQRKPSSCPVLALYWPCTGLQCIQIKSNLRRMSQRQQDFLVGALVFYWAFDDWNSPVTKSENGYLLLPCCLDPIIETASQCLPIQRPRHLTWSACCFNISPCFTPLQ